MATHSWHHEPNQGPFDLLVAADGLRSTVRQSCVAGPVGPLETSWDSPLEANDWPRLDSGIVSHQACHNVHVQVSMDWFIWGNLQDPAIFFSLEKYNELVSGFEVSLNTNPFLGLKMSYVSHVHTWTADSPRTSSWPVEDLFAGRCKAWLSQGAW